MRNDKTKATEMRRDGKSYREIREALQVPLSTLSDWFSEDGWSSAIRTKLTSAARVQHTARIVDLNKVRGENLVRVYDEAKKEAAQDLEKYRYNPLFIAGLMLYWGEGDKISKAAVRITNTDPELIALYVLFLERVCRVSKQKIRGAVLVYPDLDEKVCREYWARKSGIPLNQFTKSAVIQGRHKTRRLEYGVCTITISSTYLKVKVVEWLKLFPKELMKKEYYANIYPVADIV